VYALIFIGVLILAIACINFMNLATARSAERAREVGVRKVMGSYRDQLIIQFLVEAFLLALVSTALAVALAALVLPGFNDLIQKQLQLALGTDVVIVCGRGGMTDPSIDGITTFNGFVVAALVPVDISLTAGGRPVSHSNSTNLITKGNDDVVCLSCAPVAVHPTPVASASEPMVFHHDDGPRFSTVPKSDGRARLSIIPQEYSNGFHKIVDDDPMSVEIVTGIGIVHPSISGGPAVVDDPRPEFVSCFGCPMPVLL
jgi:hypothetical protein